MHGADPRRSRLAGEEARKSCSAPGDAYAGKPAPTERGRAVDLLMTKTTKAWTVAGPGLCRCLSSSRSATAL
ncbi:hypothetical protein D3X12_25870 [Pseudomonas protegens]|uniref:DUF1534 domain-containing protein n=1 Tax=Pseudomonas protegens TaxID=380021 RepID=A0ABY2VRA5_9PSED|nr:hypothetical protein CEP86_32210 [Pseudomonas protegens]PNV96480.1 hypothetical protein C1633_21255 [Pseudomonas protegens]QEZ53848.1 hypothetical protein D3X12_25870 [Pseudomonas protegens]QEZ59949.1 hypothetical protein D4N38_25950 [Pseudomonas protegens]QEZ65132.1 hypothetical protein D4N37_21195 [Pseudomonas protegens]